MLLSTEDDIVAWLLKQEILLALKAYRIWLGIHRTLLCRKSLYGPFGGFESIVHYIFCKTVKTIGHSFVSYQRATFSGMFSTVAYMHLWGWVCLHSAHQSSFCMYKYIYMGQGTVSLRSSRSLLSGNVVLSTDRSRFVDQNTAFFVGKLSHHKWTHGRREAWGSGIYSRHLGLAGRFTFTLRYNSCVLYA